MASSRALFASNPSTTALVNQEMQAAKPAVPACARSLERLGDESPAVTMLTTTRNGAVEHHAVPVHTCKPLCVFPRDLRVCHACLVNPARVLTATLLFLPLAAAACPTGWTPSPVSATCFIVPPERSTSLFRCVDLCKEHGGTPACISSAEENDFVTAELAAADGLWLGLYQNETGLGPARGWDRCVAGDAPSFTNWRKRQPHDYAGHQQECAWVDPGAGQWRALACDGGVRWPAELSCLCARGNASAAFVADREALEATGGYDQRLLGRRTAIAFAAAIAIALLPTLLLLGRAGWRRLRRGADAEPSVGIRGAATSPSRSTTAATLSTPSGAASSAAVKGLRAARASAAGRRLRVSFAMGQTGWALLVISMTPAVMTYAGQSIKAAVGSRLWWQVPFPPGGFLLLLALFPTDARAIRVMCATGVVVSTGLGALIIVATLAKVLPEVYGFPAAALFFFAACALAPTLPCRGDRVMQPRPALRRMWAVIRLLFLGGGVLYAGFNIADYAQGGSSFDHRALAASGVTCLLCAALATPRNRGRIHRRLGRLGGRGTEAEEAAAVAALVGGSDPDAALKRATKLLQCLPAGRLIAADLAPAGLGADPRLGAWGRSTSTSATELAAKTVPAAMGEVTAFLSHSWSDEKEAPGAKHAAVSRWAKRHQETTGKEPTLWLVALTQYYRDNSCTPPAGACMLSKLYPASPRVHAAG
eukprot:scaffold47696_cov72-Phaeocystis_antarctica.AAC.4